MRHADKAPDPAPRQAAQRGPAADRDEAAQRVKAAGGGGDLPPRQLAQLRSLQAAFGPAAQLQAEEEEPLQARFAAQAATPVQRAAEEDELLQGRFADRPAGVAQREADGAAASANRTGIPDGLKSGIEALSGMDMSAVRVHRNSSQPAQLNALAYAQGNDIRLAPGQEQHLPHEAWHVVQQRQGRVQPTMQLAGTAVNDDVSLESEADVMGARALQRKAGANDTTVVVQRVGDYLYGSANTTPHVHVYGSDSHVQIMYRRRVRRLNIVQNGQVHAQAPEALEAAAGNQTLVDIIQGLIDAV